MTTARDVIARAARLLRVALVAGLAGWATAPAGQEAKFAARAHLEPAGAVMPGQPVKLVVDAITTTWFTAAPVFPAIDIPGAVATPPGDDATNVSETVAGVRWFGVSRTYIVTPRTGGDLAIPPIALELHVGQIDKPVQAKTPALKLVVKQVQRPAGAEDALASSRLQVSQSLDRALAGLKQGDAFTRSVTVSAAGLPGMMLPPTTFPPVPGLAVYPKAPVVQDKSRQKEGFLGSTRIDAATYVMQRPGHYELPGVSISWWDTSANVLRAASAPSLAFDVAPDPAWRPALAIPDEAPTSQARPVVAHLDLRRIAAVAAAALLVALAGRLLLPRLIRWGRTGVAQLHEWREARQASEGQLWTQVRQASFGRPDAFAPALYRWLDGAARDDCGHRLSPARLDDASLPEKDSILRAWLASRYGAAADAGEHPLDNARMRRALRALRRVLRDRTAPSPRSHDLPPLNPGQD
jgi:hypothetical protein